MARVHAIPAALAIGIVATVISQPAKAATETILHAFDGADGKNPQGGLIAAFGKLFGTTFIGGGNSGCFNEGCGVVYSLKPDGSKEQTLHGFTGGTDGGNPIGSLIAAQGALYGVTTAGGNTKNCLGGCGTVFRIAEDGSFSVIYTFEGGPADGAGPFGSLLYAHGLLYGTTVSGGSRQHGTVFSLTLAGQETVLHSFRRLDGDAPMAGLIKVGNLFYGTTVRGGKNKLGNVFSMKASGKTRNVYAFQGGNDGLNPVKALVALNGVLFGTTENGGQAGMGTVFSVTPQGQEAVITSFTVTNAYPSSALTVASGMLYGTTHGTGASDATIYSVTPQGKLSTVFDFGPASEIDTDQLLYRSGAFFGAATEDAPPNNPPGALYSVTP